MFFSNFMSNFEMKSSLQSTQIDSYTFSDKMRSILVSTFVPKFLGTKVQHRLLYSRCFYRLPF